MKKRIIAIAAILVLLVGVPGTLLCWEAAAPAQTKAARSAIQTLLSPLVQSVRWGAVRLSKGLEFLVTAGQVRRDNSQLREKMSRLEAENSFLREALSKYRRLDQGEALAEIGDWKVIEADVVAYSGQHWARSLVIDRGAAHGVKPGDPVLHTKGLAGVVASVSAHTATVQLLNDPLSAVGVIVLPMRARGLVRGSGNPDTLEILLEDPSVELRRGQEVITSGMEGSLYPRGLPLGAVGDRKPNRFGQVIAEVHPAVAFGQIEEVLVLSVGHRKNPSVEEGKRAAPSLLPAQRRKR
jgi:rod shape-determining protein MreC